MSRADIAGNRAIWMLYGGMFAIFAAGEIGLAIVLPDLQLITCIAFGLALAAVAATAFLTDPPALGTKFNHVSIATISIAVAVGMVAFRPDSLIPLSPVMFMGPYCASRLTSRAQIVAHCLFASIVLAIPAAFGLIGTSATFGVAAIIPTIWLMSICVVAVLGAAEVQGEELSSLVRRDPLTGVGNRRLLDEQLAFEIERHARTGRQLSVLALDLNGFKALNDVVGHAAGDDALREVAAALRAVARDQDIVVRQGGDEFCVLLTESTTTQARFVETAIRTRLAGLADGAMPITTGIGIATFPADAQDPEGLLATADARLAADKERTGRQPDPRREGLGALRLAASVPAAVAYASATPLVPAAGGLIGQVSRDHLARNPYLWMANGAMLSMFAAFAACCALFLPGAAHWSIALALVSAIIGALVVFTKEGPRKNSWANHALLAWIYLAGAALVAAFPLAAGAGLGTAVFVGPLTAVRLTDRRQIMAHLAAASAALGLLIPAGFTDVATSLSIGMTCLGMWGLGLACVVVLEASERQGDELEKLVRRDPLTSLGNRRMLSEQLEFEFARHSRGRRPFTVLALDLNGFKPINDQFGHAAGDQLLIDVARAIERVVGGEDTVVRQGGDEFCVLLADATGEQAVSIATAIREALAQLDAHGLTITTGIGIASYPTEGTTSEELLNVADDLLRASKETALARARRSEGSAIVPELRAAS